MDIKQIEKWAEKNTSPKITVEKKMVTAWTDALINSSTINEAVENLRSSSEGFGTDFVLINSLEKASGFMQQMDGLKSVLGYIMFNHDDWSLKLMCRNLYGSVIHGNGRTILVDQSLDTEDIYYSDTYHFTDANISTDGIAGMIFIIIPNPIHTYAEDTWSELWPEMYELAQDGTLSNKVEDVSSALVPARTELMVPPAWLMGNTPKNRSSLETYYQCDSETSNNTLESESPFTSSNCSAMVVYKNMLLVCNDSSNIVYFKKIDGTTGNINTTLSYNHCMTVYGDKVYLGAGANSNYQGHRLSVWNGEGSSFTGITDDYNYNCLALASFNGRLYAAFSGTPGFRYALSEPQVAEDFTGQVTDVPGTICKLIVFKNRLYAGTINNGTPEIWASEDGDRFYNVETMSGYSIIRGMTVVNDVLYFNFGAVKERTFDGEKIHLVTDIQTGNNTWIKEHWISAVNFNDRQYVLYGSNASSTEPKLFKGNIGFRNPSVTIGNTVYNGVMLDYADSAQTHTKYLSDVESALLLNGTNEYFSGMFKMNGRIWAAQENGSTVTGNKGFYVSNDQYQFSDAQIRYSGTADIMASCAVTDSEKNISYIFFLTVPSSSGSTLWKMFYSDVISGSSIEVTNSGLSSASNASMCFITYWKGYLIAGISNKIYEYTVMFDDSGKPNVTLAYSYSLGTEITSGVIEHQNMLVIGTHGVESAVSHKPVAYLINLPGTEPVNLDGYFPNVPSGSETKYEFLTRTVASYNGCIYLSGNNYVLDLYEGNDQWGLVSTSIMLVQWDGKNFTVISGSFFRTTCAAVYNGCLFFGGYTGLMAPYTPAVKEFDGSRITDVTISLPSGDSRVSAMFADKTDGLFIAVKGNGALHAIQRFHMEETSGYLWHRSDSLFSTETIDFDDDMEVKLREAYDTDYSVTQICYVTRLKMFFISKNDSDGLYKSTDNCKTVTWIPNDKYNRSYNVTGLCEYNDALYVANSEHGIHKTVDGENFYRVDDVTFPDFSNDPEVNNIVPSVMCEYKGVLYVGTSGYNEFSGHGLYKSNDGSTFTHISGSVFPDTYSILCFYVYDDTLYIGTNNGFFTTTDGISFTHSESLTDKAIISFCYWKGSLYVGTDLYEGLYKSSGNTFINVPSVPQVIVESIFSYGDELYVCLSDYVDSNSGTLVSTDGYNFEFEMSNSYKCFVLVDNKIYMGPSDVGGTSKIGILEKVITVSSYDGLFKNHVFSIDAHKYKDVQEIMKTRSIADRMYFWTFRHSQWRD